MQVATHFFGLQVVIVFLASFISGTVLNQLSLLLSNPEKVLVIIGTGMGWSTSQPLASSLHALPSPWTLGWILLIACCICRDSAYCCQLAQPLMAE